MVRPLLFISAFVLAVALALLPLPAHAWGPLGHRLVALLAWDDMTPQARRQVEILLRGEPDPTLAGIASWADDLRKHDPVLGRTSARWHFVNLGEHDCAYEQVRDCPGGNCRRRYRQESTSRCSRGGEIERIVIWAYFFAATHSSEAHGRRPCAPSAPISARKYISMVILPRSASLEHRDCVSCRGVYSTRRSW